MTLIRFYIRVINPNRILIPESSPNIRVINLCVTHPSILGWVTVDQVQMLATVDITLNKLNLITV